MRNAAVKKLTELAELDTNIILIAGDLGYGVLDDFRTRLTRQFFNAGICEQNMTSVAAGLALEGKTVFTYSIGNFSTMRCLEQIRNDVAYHNANVKIVSVGGGLAYGSLGMTHHATEDISIMRSLPNLKIFAPGDKQEAVAAVEEIYRIPGPCYLRLGKGGETDVHKQIPQQLSKAIKIYDGDQVCILSTGGILGNALGAANILRGEGFEIALYSLPVVKPLDVETIRQCAHTYKLLISIEEHNIVGGFGGAVAEVMAEMTHNKAVLRRIGFPDVYPSIVGSQDYLRDVYGLSINKIVDTIRKAIDETI